MTRTHKHIKRPYAPPEIIQSVEIRLEVEFLGSVVDKVQPVETAGQKSDGIYDATNTDPGSATFNYEWGDSAL